MGVDGMVLNHKGQDITKDLPKFIDMNSFITHSRFDMLAYQLEGLLLFGWLTQRIINHGLS